MSSMASEMEARMREDGSLGDPGTGATGSVAPGTDGTGNTATPSAETSNTDTGGTGPGPVPYSRFKEVNDELQNLRGYSDLRNYGYDPDSLRELAAFDSAYRTDPLATTSVLIDNLPGISDEVKAGIKEQLGVQANPETPPAGSTGATGTNPDDKPPAWAQPLLNDYEQRQANDQKAAQDATVQAILADFNAKDAAAEVTTNPAVALKFIQAELASGHPYQTVQEVADAARETLKMVREGGARDLVDTLPRNGRTTSVPGGTLPSTPPRTFKSLADANKHLEHILSQGQTP
jgi:hypothetical protein